MKRVLPWFVVIPLLIGMAERGDDTPPQKKVPTATKTGEAHQVPYRLTPTKHVLVRAKFNGQGPYNLVIDTGAPVLILAKKVNDALKIEQDKAGWGTVDKLEFEGGVVLDKTTIRFDDLYQLEGMNGLGLAGTEIHGLVGFPILSQFRITYDYSHPKLTWKKVDSEHEELPRRPLRGGAPGGLDALGSLMKTVGKFFGMGPAPKPEPRGFLGFQCGERDGKVVVIDVVPGGPADVAGMKPDDRIDSVNEKAIDAETGLKKALDNVRPDEKVTIEIQRGENKQTLSIICGRGF